MHWQVEIWPTLPPGSGSPTSRDGDEDADAESKKENKITDTGLVEGGTPPLPTSSSGEGWTLVLTRSGTEHLTYESGIEKVARFARLCSRQNLVMFPFLGCSLGFNAPPFVLQMMVETKTAMGIRGAFHSIFPVPPSPIVPADATAAAHRTESRTRHDSRMHNKSEARFTKGESHHRERTADQEKDGDRSGVIQVGSCRPLWFTADNNQVSTMLCPCT